MIAGTFSSATEVCPHPPTAVLLNARLPSVTAVSPSSSATACPTSSSTSITCPSIPMVSVHEEAPCIPPSSVKQKGTRGPKSTASALGRGVTVMVLPQQKVDEYSVMHVKPSLEVDELSTADNETAAKYQAVLNNFRKQISKIYETVASSSVILNGKQNDGVFPLSPKASSAADMESVERIKLKTKSDTGFDRSTVKEIKTGVQSETALNTENRIRSKVDLSLIRSESKINLEQSLSQIIKPGLTGLKEFMSSRHLTKSNEVSQITLPDKDQPYLNRFIDYFIDCDGLRYLGILEQIELDFEDRCKAALLNAQPNKQADAVCLRAKLANITEIQPSTQQKTLKEFNFPELLSAQIKTLSINYKPKIIAIRRIHEFGIDMEKYWLEELEGGASVSYVEIYETGTQMLAELMAQLFSLLVKSCEFLMQVNEQVMKYRDKYTAHSLISLFTEFRTLLVEEVSAVGETCGGVMVKIPDMTDTEVIDIMTKLYSQVNFVDICLCKALRTVVPLIILHDYTRLMQNY